MPQQGERNTGSRPDKRCYVKPVLVEEGTVDDLTMIPTFITQSYTGS